MNDNTSNRFALGLIFPWIVAGAIILIFSGCGSNVLCPTEYKVDGVWKKCSYIQQTGCGLDLNCEGTPILCTTGVESRTSECR